MIGIDSRRFNRKAIRKLYGHDPSAKESWGAAVRHVRDAIIDRIDELDSHELTRAILGPWLFDGFGQGGALDADGLSEARIARFLLRHDTTVVIEDCAKRACRFLWHDESLNHALLCYREAAGDACKLGDWDERLDRLLIDLDPGVVDAGMLEYGNRHGLEAEDLQHPVRRGTLCASKDKLMSLRTTREREMKQFHEDCKAVFDYGWFSRRLRDAVLVAMNVDVCPYCNRQYVSTWGLRRRRSTADIDHFFAKDRFPYLALSLFNFVPSCQVCNSRFKLARDFYARPHANPHEGGFGSAARFEVDDIGAIIDLDRTPGSGDSGPDRTRLFSMHVDSGAEDVANSRDTFHLDELYESHDDYAMELVRKARIFGPSQIDEYLSEYGGMFSHEGELYRTIFGNYLGEDDLGQRPLAKMTRDLLRDLGVPIVRS